jgi:DNA topoisomerase VI subunit A
MAKAEASTLGKLEGMGRDMRGEIAQAQSPTFACTVRSRGNVLLDNRGYLKLGDKRETRTFLNMGQAKKFMQTVAIAAKCKKFLKENLHTSIRGLFYQLKFSLGEDIDEELFSEQAESNPIIEDLEVALDVKREDFNLSTDRKGVVAGNVVLKDRFGGETTEIDCSKQGRSGWMIPSDVDNGMEFVSVDADYVLVVEKDALWQRLNEDKFWKKENCVLITPKGQASRGCRRLIRRLADRKLPVIVCSIDAQEPVLLVDESGSIRNECIGEYVDKTIDTFGSLKTPRFEKSIAPDSGAFEVDAECKTEVGRVLNVVRHPINEPLYEITTEAGFTVRTTRSHSVMAFEDYAPVPKSVGELRKGDLLLAPLKVPNNESLAEIDFVELMKREGPELLDDVWLAGDLSGVGLHGKQPRINLRGAAPYASLEGDASALKNAKMRLGKSEIHIPCIVKATPELARLLGYFAAEGSLGEGVTLTFGTHEKEYIEDAIRCIESVFGCRQVISRPHGSATQIRFGGRMLDRIFEKALRCGRGAANKRVPSVVFNMPNALKYEFLRGYFRGDGGVKLTKKGCRLWACTVSRRLASDVVLLLLQLGCWATIEKKRGRENELEKYHILIYNRESLKKLRSIAVGIAPYSAEYIDREILKSPVFKSVPTRLLKPLQGYIYGLSGKGISDIFSQKTISFAKLRRILDGIGKKPLKREGIMAALKQKSGVSASEICALTGEEYRTVFKCLRQAERKGIVESRKVAGSRVWFDKRIAVPALGRELQALRNLAENEIALLPVKSIKQVASSNGFVYDIEVNPTHTFVGGVGPLLLHNTDCDAWGWYIYWTIKTGSMSLAYLGDNIATPEAKFIGVTMQDIKQYDFLGKLTIKAKDVDIKRAEEMLTYEWISKYPAWVTELKTVLDTKKKLEQDALQGPRLTFVGEYLKEKMEKKIFLP